MNDDRQGGIRVNGAWRELDVDDVERLLAGLGYSPGQPGIAVAVNGRVVRRADWAAQSLEAGDEIDIVGAVQGG